MTRNQRDPLFLVQPNKQALVITSLKVQIQTRVHQRLATVRPIERIARIPRIAVQTLHLEWWRRRLDGSVLLESEDEGLVFLLVDELHGGPVGLVGQAQAVEAAGDDDGVDFLPGGEDGGDGGGFFGGEVGGLELEAEGATLGEVLVFWCVWRGRERGVLAYHESDVGAVLDGDIAGGEVVGDHGNVASHSRRWVGKRSTELDGQTVRSVSVVGSPVLGPVVKEASIETATTRGATLPEDIRVLGGQGIDHVVDAEHVVVVVRRS